MRQLPLALTLLRLVLAPLVLMLSGRPHPITFGLILAAAVLSDIFDGVLARRLGVATAALRRLDSKVDIVFYLAVGVALWRLRPEVVRAHGWLLVSVVGLELLRLGFDRFKYGLKASYHLWSAKAWGLALFLGALMLLAFDGGSAWFGLMLWPGVFENLEGLAVSLLLPKWTHDVPTVFHTRRRLILLADTPSGSMLEAGGSMNTRRPDVSEFPTSHAVYVNEAPEGDIVDALRRQAEEIQGLLGSLPESMGGHRYAPGKWSIRELVGHLNDAEKCFEHRAFRFSRGDTSPLPGFDEDAYVAASRFDVRTLADLGDEFGHLRAATLATFDHLAPEAWDRRGIANGKEVSVRALAFVIAGHAQHHLKVLRERYLG